MNPTLSPGHPALRRTPRRGFSFVEILSVLSVIGILAGIGAGRLQPARELVATARIASDLRLIRLTAEEHANLYDAWPRTAPEGEAPAELVGQLGSIQFRTEDYVLQYVRHDTPGFPPQVTVTVRALRPDLDEHLDAALGDSPGFTRSGTVLSYTVSGGRSMASPESGTIAAPDQPEL